MLYRVALLSPPYSTLTYCDPAWLADQGQSFFAPGLRLALPLGRGADRVGVVLERFSEDSPANDLPPEVKIRPWIWPLDNPKQPGGNLLKADYLELVRQLAARQGLSPGRVLGSVLPQGLRDNRQIKLRHFLPGSKPRLYALRELSKLPPEELNILGQAFLEGQAEILQQKSDKAAGEICRLMVEAPWPLRPNALRQRELLDYLLSRGDCSRRHLRSALPQAVDALPSLLRAGLVQIVPDCPTDEDLPGADAISLLPPPDAPFELSPDQQQAMTEIIADLDDNQAHSRLLYGVTGSGKTAVYLELAKACLERGRSCLILAPEVALALKLRRDVQERFPQIPLFFFHGYQTPSRREDLFRQLAARSEPCVLVGSRSALFLPLPQLGAIILDEEHDSSFKQDEGLSYQAKEVAWQRAAQDKALLLLGSATPDIKSFYAAQQGLTPISRLSSRVGGGMLPQIELLDIKGKSSGLLAPASLEALRDTVKRGEQAVVLLNRRGYAPLMYCLSCGKSARCPHCDIALTYHKRREQLVCHYCGYTRNFPSPCSSCGSLNFLPMGDGTEKMEENLGLELAQILGGQGRVLRLDRDNARNPERMEGILASFARQEAQILIGTQMLSKGHHFPQVTLALIADGDLGLNLPDYRAAERTFQLLTQSAGRAGRGSKPGRVLIQTRDQSHYCWEHIQSGDYEGFYQAEIALREKRRYPPFVKLALVRMSFSQDCQRGPEQMSLFAKALRQAGRSLDILTLGPAPAPLARLQMRLRHQILIKASDWRKIRQAYAQALAQCPPAPKDWRISLDLDPVNML